MRICLTAAVAALLWVSAPAAAAPNSMLQTLPSSQKQQDGGGERLSWLTKWFRRDEPARPTNQVAEAPPIAAYQAPPAAALGASPAAATISPHTMPAAAHVASQAAQPTSTLPPATSSADCKALRRQGHAHDRAGDLVTAEGLYRRAFQADPSSAAALNDLGLCLARQEKFEASAQTLAQAIAMRPDKALYRNNIATVLVELGRTEDALANLKSVYEPVPAHYNLGQLLSRAGNEPEAAEQWRVVLRLQPDYAPAREALAALEGVPPVVVATAEVIDVPPPPVVVARVPAVAEPPSVPGPRLAAAQPVGVSPVEAEREEPTGVPSMPRLLPPVLDR